MDTLHAWEQLFYLRERMHQHPRLRPIILKALHQLDYFKSIAPKIILISGKYSSEISAHLLQQLGIAHGQRVGLFLSNSLISLNEQIRFNGKIIAESVLLSLLDKTKQLGHELKLNGTESLLLAALDYFEEKNASLIIIESELGWAEPAIHYLRSDLLLLMDDHRSSEKKEVKSKEREAEERMERGSLSFSRQGSVIVAIKHPSAALKKNLTDLGVHAFWLGEHWQLSEDCPEKCVLTGIKRQRYLFPVGQYDAHGMASAIVSWEALFGEINIDLLLQAISEINIAGSFHELTTEPVMIVDTCHSLERMRSLARRLIDLEEKKYLKGWNILCDLPLVDQDATELEIFKMYPRFDFQFFSPPIGKMNSNRLLLEEGIVTQLCILKRQHRHRIAKFLHQLRLDALLNKKGLFVFGSYEIVSQVFYIMGIGHQFYCPSHCSVCPIKDTRIF